LRWVIESIVVTMTLLDQLAKKQKHVKINKKERLVLLGYIPLVCFTLAVQCHYDTLWLRGWGAHIVR